MTYEKNNLALEKLLKDPWKLENEREITSILKDESTPKEVVNRIINRYEEMIKEIVSKLENGV